MPEAELKKIVDFELDYAAIQKAKQFVTATSDATCLAQLTSCTLIFQMKVAISSVELLWLHMKRSTRMKDRKIEPHMVHMITAMRMKWGALSLFNKTQAPQTFVYVTWM